MHGIIKIALGMSQAGPLLFVDGHEDEVVLEDVNSFGPLANALVGFVIEALLFPGMDEE